MDENNLKAAIDLQKELFKTAQDQIKSVEERARQLLTLGSSAFALIVLLIRPQDFTLTPELLVFRTGFFICFFTSSVMLIFLFFRYRILSLPSLTDLPDPNSVEELGNGKQSHTETLSAILETHTQNVKVALALYKTKTQIYVQISRGTLVVFMLITVCLFVGTYIFIA